MADAMTTTSSLDFDQTMWDRAAYFSLRPQLYFDAFADVQQTNATPSQGASLTFTIVNDLAVVSTTLNESVDVDAVALSDSQVTLTLAEYGNAVNSTWRVRATSFIDLDPVIANAVGFNAGISQDTWARAVVQAGTNVRYAGQAVSRATVIPTDTLTAKNPRRAVAELRGANVSDFGGFYAGIMHPDVSYDFRTDVGTDGWRVPHNYAQPTEIWNGEIGAIDGVRWIESPRAPVFADAGSSTTLTDVYGSLVFGRQAIAKAFSTYDGHGPSPTIVIGPVTDHLRRFRPVGWHFFGAYGRFREVALRRLESSSSIGVNS